MIKLILILSLISIYLKAQPTKQYIMAVHTCTTCGDPSFHTTRIIESNDGINWSQVPGTGFTFSGSVPEPIIRDDKLYIYTPGKVNIYNASTNTWDATGESVIIYTDETKTSTVSYVDPSAIIDDDNKINLFFLNSTGISGDPAVCSSYPCTKYFDSAIEVAGSGGKEFILSSGHRLELTISSGSASDPDIFYDGTNYYMYISRGSSTYAYSSTTRHGAYSVVSSLPGGEGLLTSDGGIPCGHYNPSIPNYWTFVHSGSPTEIKRKAHPNFNVTLSGFSTVVNYSTFGLSSGTSVASPGFVVNTLSTLPVELTNFSGLFCDNKVILSWQTATEVNNYGFEVEKKASGTGSYNHWRTIGFVEGNGNSHSPKEYSFTESPDESGKFKYRLKQIDTDGSTSYSNEIEVEVIFPGIFELSQNYPNPFNPATTIMFTLAEDGFTKLKIYDILGNEIETLVNDEREAGKIHKVIYDGGGLTSGVYYYKLESGGKNSVRKFLLLK